MVIMLPPIYIVSAMSVGVLGVQAEINPPTIKTMSVVINCEFIFMSSPCKPNV